MKRTSDLLLFPIVPEDWISEKFKQIRHVQKCAGLFLSLLWIGGLLELLYLSGRNETGANNTKEYVWRQNKDYEGGATCWSSNLFPTLLLLYFRQYLYNHNIVFLFPIIHYKSTCTWEFWCNKLLLLIISTVKNIFHLSENPTAPLPHHIVPPRSGKQWFHSRLLLRFHLTWLQSEIRCFFISMKLEAKFMRLDSNIDSKSSNNTYVNIVKMWLLFYFIYYRYHRIRKLTNKTDWRKHALSCLEIKMNNFLLNQLCETSLFTKKER